MAARRVPRRGRPLAPRSPVEQDGGDRRIVHEMLGPDLSRRVLVSASPVALQPVLQWLRELFVSNVRHVSQIAFQGRMLGRARDPHGGRARPPHNEEPGVLGELRSLVERAIATNDRKDSYLKKRIRTISEIEQRKGTNLFPTMDPALKERLRKLRAADLWSSN